MPERSGGRRPAQFVRLHCVTCAGRAVDCAEKARVASYPRRWSTRSAIRKTAVCGVPWIDRRPARHVPTQADDAVWPVWLWVSVPAGQLTQTVLPVAAPRMLYVLAGQAEGETKGSIRVLAPVAGGGNRALGCRSLPVQEPPATLIRPAAQAGADPAHTSNSSKCSEHNNVLGRSCRNTYGCTPLGCCWPGFRQCRCQPGTRSTCCYQPSCTNWRGMLCG